MEHLIGKEVRIGSKHAREFCYETVVGRKAVFRSMGHPDGNPLVDVDHGVGDIYGWHVHKEDILPLGDMDNEVGLAYIERSDPFA